MVTINQKEASLLEQKTEQIIALVCRREKQKRLQSTYISVYAVFMHVAFFRSLSFVHFKSRHHLTLHSFHEFRKEKKMRLDLRNLKQFLFPHKNVSVFDNQKICSNDYFSLFHLPVMEIQTPFLTHNTLVFTTSVAVFF